MARRPDEKAEQMLGKVLETRAESGRGEVRYRPGDRVLVRTAMGPVVSGVVISSRPTAHYGEVVTVKLKTGETWTGAGQRVMRG